MKKMTKKERVEDYMENLMTSEEFTVENLMSMTVYDLFGNAQLEGIGKTTLSGALNAFKKRHGLKKTGKGGVVPVKNTKKERVERYLTNVMKQDGFSVDDLMNLTVYDLFGNAELEGIGKTTLSSGISAFKKKFLKVQYRDDAIGKGGPAALAAFDKKKVFEEPELPASLRQAFAEPEEAAEELNETYDEDSFEDVLINTIGKEDAPKPVVEEKHEVMKHEVMKKPKITIKKKGKRKKKKDVLRKEVVPTIVKETTREVPQVSNTAPVRSIFDDSEMSVLKAMINQFNKETTVAVPSEPIVAVPSEPIVAVPSEPVAVIPKEPALPVPSAAEKMELIELKHALKYFGIDYQSVVKRYRENA